MPDLSGPDGSGQTALLRLMAWLSPAFPVGSFSYSHGLEAAVERGLVADTGSLRNWISDLLTHGSAWNDAVLLAEAHQAVGGDDLGEVAELAAALAGSRERHMETMLQGSAFLKAVAAWFLPAMLTVNRTPTPDPSPQGGGEAAACQSPSPLWGGVRGGGAAVSHPMLPEQCPYPVAVGAVAGAHGIPLASTLAAYVHAFASNQIQAAIRLSVIGQSEATATLAALEPVIEHVATRAAQSSLDDLGSASLMAEVAAMQHETQYSRLFRS